MEPCRSLGKHNSFFGIYMDRVAAVICTIVAAGQHNIARPLVVIICIVIRRGTGIFRYVCKHRPSLGASIIDFIQIKYVSMVNSSLHIIRVAADPFFISTRHIRRHFNGGQRAILIINLGKHIGTPIFLEECHSIILQLRRNRIHDNREGNHIARHIHFMSIKGRHMLSVHYLVEIGYLAPFAFYVDLIAKVAFAVSSNAISTFRTARKHIPIHVLAIPERIRAIQAKRNRKPCVWLIHGLKGVRSPVLEIHFTALLILHFHYYQTGIPQLIEDDIIDIVKEIIPIRRNRKVLLVVNGLVAIGFAEQVLPQIKVSNAFQLTS